MQWATFIARLMPDLIALGRELFTTHKGDLKLAQRDIRSRKEAIAQDRAEADARIAALKAQKGAPGCGACQEHPDKVCDRHL